MPSSTSQQDFEQVVIRDDVAHVRDAGAGADDLARRTDPLCHTAIRTYGAVSRLITQTDPRGRLTGYTDDPTIRPSTQADPPPGLQFGTALTSVAFRA